MCAKRLSLLLVESHASIMGKKRPIFRTGERITQSGIYRVRHGKHRLPHEVTLLIDEHFPRCAKCQDAVTFQLVRGLRPTVAEPAASDRIRLYELPVLEDERNEEIAV